MSSKQVDQERIETQWITYGGYSGLIFALLFISSAVLPLPREVQTIAALISPLFLVVAHIGLYRLLARQKDTLSAQLAMVFGICAPVLVSAMLTVQMSLVSYMTRFYTPLDQATKDAQINIWRAVDSVQLGLDVAWDMFILPTVILFSLNVMRHPAFGRIFGIVGLVFGTVGLVLNIGTFPTPPINVGLIDIGPFVVCWYAILFVLMIRASRKHAARVAGGMGQELPMQA